MKEFVIHLAAALLALTPFNAKAQSEYITPPQVISDLVLAKPVPTAIFNNQCSMAVVVEKTSPFIPLQQYLDMNEYRVGGARIDANNFSASRYKEVISNISLITVPEGKAIKIAGIPQSLGLFDIKWSADGSFFCFLNRTRKEIELYRVNATAAQPKAEKINTNKVNATFGINYAILPNGSVLYKSVPKDIGAFPKKGMPKGPVEQKTNGKKDTHATFEDCITCAYDEDVFTYLCTSILSVWDGRNTRTIGTKQIFRDIVPSPDGNFLMVTTEHKPYSYVRPHSYFPSRLAIWSIDGNEVRVLMDLPKEGSDNAVKAKEKKPSKGSYEWRADKAAALAWTETLPGTGIKAQKDGDEEEDDGRTFFTSVWQCEAPFDLDKGKSFVFRSEYKLVKVEWGNDNFAIYYDSSSKKKIDRTICFNPSDTAAAKTVLFSQTTGHDTIGNAPIYGSPLKVRNQYGQSVVYLDPKGKFMFFTGKRPDAEGDKMSFIDKYTFKGGKSETVWTCAAPYSEDVIRPMELDNNSIRFITLRQSAKEVPNYNIVEVGKKDKEARTSITCFENPYPALNDVQDTFITYKRADGVTLTARLFLPAGYNKERDGKLPVFMWTYPYEYKCAAEAQKRRQDRYTFPVPNRQTHIMWATQGYAVLQGFSMPIIAKSLDGHSNDDFINQIIMNAEAAVKYLDQQGIGDKNRVAVGGHSYGAFMTANLMTHTRMFKAGLAESGAFNRTLTPFGFQNETRTYWNAKKVYDAMSPFNYADKLSGHLLLVHGTMDENSGTFPIQSERLFQAFAAHGGDADFIQLPYEQHGYVYTENMLHLFGATYNMLEKYVKNAKPAETKTK